MVTRGLVLIDVAVLAAPWQTEKELRSLIALVDEVHEQSGIEVGVHWKWSCAAPIRTHDDAALGWRDVVQRLGIEPRRRRAAMPAVLLSFVDDGPWSLRVPLAAGVGLRTLVVGAAGMLVERLDGAGC